jgi:serine/threonine-protein kinase RsbW
MPHQYQLARAAELSTLGVMRDFIDEACRTEGTSEDTAFKLKLAVDEACTNIIEHGYAGMDPGSIILTLKFDPQLVVIDITDFGQPFEPSEPLPPDAAMVLRDQSVGGFGLYFIYQTMDQVDYQTSELGNTLIFTKRR